MDIRNNVTESRRLGLELHAAETAIHIGRQAIGEIRTAEPVDEAALEIHRTGIHEARLARNTLRSQLEAVKLTDNALPSYRWW